MRWTPPRGGLVGHRLAARVRGAGPALLLIHGLGGSGRYWGAHFDALADGHRLIVPDLPGFGGSPPSGRGYGAEAHTAALLELLDSLGEGGPLVVAGHSVGALIGLRLAASLPERVRTVVAFSPPLFASRPAAESHFRSLGALERAVALESRATVVAQRWLTAAGPAGRAFAVLARPDLPLHLALDGARAHPEAYRSTLREVMMSGAAPAWLAAFPGPVTLATGAADRLASPAGLAAVAERHPNVRLCVFEAADHHLPLLEPAACAALIREAAAPV